MSSLRSLPPPDSIPLPSKSMSNEEVWKGMSDFGNEDSSVTHTLEENMKIYSQPNIKTNLPRYITTHADGGINRNPAASIPGRLVEKSEFQQKFTESLYPLVILTLLVAGIVFIGRKMI